MKLLMQVQAVYASDVAVHADGQNAADGPGAAAPADPYEPDAAAAHDDKAGGHEQQQRAGQQMGLQQLMGNH
jgi:hypothetical protein